MLLALRGESIGTDTDPDQPAGLGTERSLYTRSDEINFSVSRSAAVSMSVHMEPYSVYFCLLSLDRIHICIVGIGALGFLNRRFRIFEFSNRRFRIFESTL